MRMFFLGLALCAGALSLPAQTTAYHRARIYYSEPGQLTRLQAMGVGIDHGLHKQNFSFESDFTAEELRIVAAEGMRYDLTIRNVDQFYLNQNIVGHPDYVAASDDKNAVCPGSEGPEIVTPANYNPGSMGGFLTYQELLDELDDMYAYSEANNLHILTPRSDLVNPADADDFRTVNGNYLQWVKFSDDPDVDDATEPQILYDALHHAREPASMQQLVFFMWYLLENYATSAEVRSIVDNTELYFIPCVNPDGYLYNEQTNPQGGGFWRKNLRGGYGVDLNRNYNYITPGGVSAWNTTGVSDDLSSDIYPGTAPFSEPETRAMRYFVEQHRLSIALNNHTSGGLLLFPFGYELERYSPDHAYYQQLSEGMVRANGYTNMLSSLLYPASGDSDDFMYGFLTTRDGGTRPKVLAMTPEIGNAFWPALNEIESIVKGMLVHNLTAAHAAGNFAFAEETTFSTAASTDFPITYHLTQVGLVPAAITVSLEPVSGNIAGVGPAETYTALTSGEQAGGTISLQLAPSIEPGEVFVFDLVVDNGRFQQKQRVSKLFGALSNVVASAAETLMEWNTAGPWSTTNQTFYPGSPAASITDSPAGNYASDAINNITLREGIDLTDPQIQAAKLNFYAKWEIEADYDQVQLLVSADGGASWIPQCGKYTVTGRRTHQTPEEPVYDGFQSDWVREEIDLSDYLGQTLQLRFELRSDQAVEGDGYYFDQLSVDVIKRVPVGANEAILTPVNLLPNPTSDLLTIVTELQDYDYELTDVSGRQLYAGSALRNNTTVNLENLPAGFYLLNLRQAGRSRTLKIVKE